MNLENNKRKIKDDPNIHYIEGIIEEYHKALQKVELWGPTFFKPILRKMIQRRDM